MSRRNQNVDLPFNGPAPAGAATATVPATAPQAQRIEKPGKESGELAEVLLPIDPSPLPSEFCISINCRLNVEQSSALRRIALALEKRDAVLANGQRINNTQAALRYILEQAGRSHP